MKGKSRVSGVVIFPVLLVIIAVAIVGYVGFRLINPSSSYLSVSLPDGWSIEERTSGYILETDPASGLLGFLMKDDEGVAVFEAEGVWGLGGDCMCETYYSFDDTSSEDDANKVECIQTMGGTDYSLADFALAKKNMVEGQYTEFAIFDHVVRRSNNILFQDTNPSEEYFDPMCGVGKNVYEINGLGYELLGDDSSISLYEFSIPEGISEEKLILLDTTLSSLEIK